MKTFWRNNERFADLFNAVAFNGRQVINPDELTEMDTDVSGIIQFNDYNESLVRTRDIIKKFHNGIEFTILGLELQTNPHYAMPVRALLYDGLGYLKECNEFRNIHKPIIKQSPYRHGIVWISLQFKTKNSEFNTIMELLDNVSCSDKRFIVIIELNNTGNIGIHLS
jgi:hypothetical protein